MKLLRLAAFLPAFMLGTLAFANVETLTFAGECELALKGRRFETIDTFQLKADPGECPGKNMIFSVPNDEGSTEYGIYVEFQRSPFGKERTDKPYFAYFKKSEGILKNWARAFNVEVGTILEFNQEIDGKSRLHCVGRIS